MNRPPCFLFKNKPFLNLITDQKKAGIDDNFYKDLVKNQNPAYERNKYCRSCHLQYTEKQIRKTGKSVRGFAFEYHVPVDQIVIYPEISWQKCGI